MSAETQTSDNDITQQVTSIKPAVDIKVKNPNRVAAGKAIAEKTRLAREAQKKAADEAKSIIEEKNNAKAAPTPPTPPTQSKPEDAIPSGSGLTVNQGLAVLGLATTLIGLYYKREELKAVFNKKTPQASPESITPPEPMASPPSRIPKPKKGLQNMD